LDNPQVRPVGCKYLDGSLSEIVKDVNNFTAYKALQFRADEYLKAHPSLQKRSPQGNGMASILGGLSVLQSWFESVMPRSNKGPTSTVPEIADENSKQFQGALKRKVRYGPYRIPATSEKNIESEFFHTPGMGNTFLYDARKPCENECSILGFEMSLEFENGSIAENANGVSLQI
jgi:hypothetical protein